jgi:hypothetical protein
MIYKGQLIQSERKRPPPCGRSPQRNASNGIAIMCFVDRQVAIRWADRWLTELQLDSGANEIRTVARRALEESDRVGVANHRNSREFERALRLYTVLQRRVLHAETAPRETNPTEASPDLAANSAAFRRSQDPFREPPMP